MENIELELNLKILFAIAKGRNICYYYSIDKRPRKVYFHILREYRIQLKNLLEELKNDNSNETKTLNNIFNILPPKIKPEDCGKIIYDLSKFFIKKYER